VQRLCHILCLATPGNGGSRRPGSSSIKKTCLSFFFAQHSDTLGILADFDFERRPRAQHHPALLSSSQLLNQRARPDPGVGRAVDLGCRNLPGLYSDPHNCLTGCLYTLRTCTHSKSRRVHVHNPLCALCACSFATVVFPPNAGVSSHGAEICPRHSSQKIVATRLPYQSKIVSPQGR
jgi:hypothetical protein